MADIIGYEKFEDTRKKLMTVSTRFLEERMKNHYKLNTPENLDKTIGLADKIIEHDCMNVAAYITATESSIVLDFNYKALGYLDRILKVRPDETKALSLKMIVLDSLYTAHQDIQYFLELVNITELTLDITKDDPEMINYIIENCPTITDPDLKIIDKALEIEPDNISLLFKKGIMMTERFEDGIGYEEDFRKLVTTAKKMRSFYPDHDKTLVMIVESYDALPKDMKRQYRNVLNMPELHKTKILPIR